MKHVQFSKDDRIIDICRDNVFKAIFTRDTSQSNGALKNLISAILEKELEVIAITANEPPVNNTRDRQIRFDIAVKMDNGELANVEMTLNPQTHEQLRMEYYLARYFVSQDIRGDDKDFGDLKHTWQISLLNKDLFQDDSFIHEFEYYDQKRRTFLNGRSHIIVVELLKVESIAGKPVSSMDKKERWAAFFRYCADPNKRELINELLGHEEGIAMAGETLLTVSQDEKEWLRLENEFRNILDRQTEKAEARKEGRAEGREEGIEVGLKEGLAEGRAEGQLEMARNLKALDVPIEKIASASGLSPEQIKEL
jgi:predicted transposase/invertase (TIGR01784 family)